MACLRDILHLFGPNHNPFYAGFGNRLTDALSYRSVNIPSTRIFTINSNGEVLLDLLTLTKYKSSYVSMRDLVDHFFPPVSLLSQDEEYTDFNYWRDSIPDPDEFTDSEDEEERKRGIPLMTRGGIVQHSEEEEDEEEDEDEAMRESFMTGASGDYTEGEGHDDETYGEDDGEEYEEDDGELYEEEEDLEDEVQDGEQLEEKVILQTTHEGLDHNRQDLKQEDVPNSPPHGNHIALPAELLDNMHWIKDNVEGSMVEQMGNTVDREIKSVVGEIGEQLQKLRGRDQAADEEKGVNPTAGVMTSDNCEREEEQERYVATQMV